MNPVTTSLGRARLSAAVTALALLLPLLMTVLSAKAHADTAEPRQFVPIQPTKLIDSRDGTGGVANARVSANGSLTFQVAGVAGIPASGVTAVALNLTAASPDKFGWFTIFPSDAPVKISSLTYHPGESATGEDFTRLSDTGKVTVVNNSDGAVDIAISARGYFLSATTSQASSEYYPVATDYLYDTRPGLVTGSPAHQAAPVPANSSVTIDVAGQKDIPASGTTAVALNLVVTGQAQSGSMTVHPSDLPDTTTISAVDYVPGETDSSFFIAQMSSTGKITLVNHGSSSVHISVTVRGYFKAASEEGGSGYQTIPTKELVNTVTGAGAPGGSTQPLGPGASLTFNVLSGIDLGGNDMTAAALNVNGRRPTQSGWLSVYPAEDGDPGISSVNYDEGGESTNGFDLVIPDSQGQVTVTNHSQGTVHLQVSMRGYFTEPPPPVDYENVPDSNVVEDDGNTHSASNSGSRNFYIKTPTPWNQLHVPGTNEGTISWYGGAPYDVYMKGAVLDNSADSYCIAAVFNADGRVFSGSKYRICGFLKRMPYAGWYQGGGVRSMTVKVCRWKNGKFSYCNKNWS